MDARELLIRFIAEEFLLDPETPDIPDDLNLIEAGIVDSLGMLRLVAFLEEDLGVIIEPEAVTPENLCSIRSMLALVTAPAEG